MATITINGAADILETVKVAYAATQAGVSTVSVRTANSMVITKLDGTIITFTGQNLTYAGAGETYHMGTHDYNIEGMLATGTITGITVQNPDESTKLEIINANYDAANMVPAYWSLFNHSVSSGGASIGFASFVFAENDTVYGTAEDNIIDVSDVVTTLRSYRITRDGDDTIYGGGGNDTITAGDGNDTVSGGTGNDTIYGDFAGLPRTMSGSGSVSVVGGNDTISGGLGNDKIYGRGGDDVLWGNAGDDELHGDGGNDTLHYQVGNDLLDGGAGNDTASFAQAISDFTDLTYTVETFHSHNGPPYQVPVFKLTRIDAQGTSYTVTIQKIEQFTFSDQSFTQEQMIAYIDENGTPGSSTVNDIAGYSQTLTGLSTNDTFVINSASTNYNWSLTDDGTGIVVWNIETNKSDLLFGFEHINFTDISIPIADLEAIFSGTANNDYINFAYPSNTDTQVIQANEGNDTVFGGEGEDIIYGGDGNDHLIGDYAINPNAGHGTTNVAHHIGQADRIFGGNGNDIIQGQGGDDMIDGGQGDDIMSGGFGSDLFTLSEGNDTVSGGTNDYTYFDGIDTEVTDTLDLTMAITAFDSITYQTQTGYGGIEYPAFTFTWTDSAGNVNTTTAHGIEKFSFTDGPLTLAQMIQHVDGTTTNPLEGTLGDDNIVGTDADDEIDLSMIRRDGQGLDTIDTGKDTVHAGKGNDTIIAGMNSDTIFGEVGNDTIYGDYRSVPNTPNAPLNRGQERIGNDDKLYGGAGDDTILGRGGNDFIDGGKGNDTLVGDWGSDTFILSEGKDIIDGSSDHYGAGSEKAGVTDTLKMHLTTTDFTSITYQTTGSGNTEQKIFTFTWKNEAGETQTTTVKNVEKFDFKDKGLSLDELVKLVDDSASNGDHLVFDNPDQNQDVTGTTSNDVFVIKGNAADYGWGATEDGTGIVVWNDTGYDILTGFEAIKFADITIPLTSSGGKYQDIPTVNQSLQGEKGGHDTFVIDGKSADYGWGATDDGNGVVVWNDTNYDILEEFEDIQFNDQTVSLSEFSA